MATEKRGAPGIGDVTDHAQKLIEELAANGKIGGDPMPDFSKGTAALDADGKPIVGEEQLPLEAALPAGEAVPQTEEARQAQADALAEASAANPSNQATEPVPTVPRGTVKEAPVGTQEAGTQAAEAAAAAVVEDWADFEVDDPTTGQKFQLRAPKAQVEQARKGYLRQADYTKKTMFLARAKAVLEPLIADGRIDNVLPLLQRAVDDPEYATFAIEAYNRRVQGLPLTQQQQQAAAAVETVRAAQGATDIPVLSAEEDPYLAGFISPLQKQLQDVTQRFDSYESQQRATQEAQREQQQRAEAGARIVQTAHVQLVQDYPDAWTGNLDKDQNLLHQVVRYARESGMTQAWGENPATLMRAYETMRRAREDAVASPAAAAIANNSVLEQQIARANANTVGGGAAATVQTKKAPPVYPATRDANGKAVPMHIFQQQLKRYNAAVAALAG